MVFVHVCVCVCAWGALVVYSTFALSWRYKNREQLLTGNCYCDGACTIVLSARKRLGI